VVISVDQPVMLAFSHWTRPLPIARLAPRLANAGYDAIFLMGDPDGFDVDQVGRVLEGAGLACLGMNAMTLGGLDLISEQPDVRFETVAYVKKLAQLAHALGGRLIGLNPNEIGRTAPRADPAMEWRWAVDGLRSIVEVSMPLGVQVGIEPVNRFETNFVNRADQAVRLAQEVGDGVGVILDTFHLNIEEVDPAKAILDSAPWLLDVQVADSNRRPPGHGHLDWLRLFGALRLGGFDGSVTAEWLWPDDRTPIGRSDGGIRSAASELPADATNERFKRDSLGRNFTDSEFDLLLVESARFVRGLLDRHLQKRSFT
jgi:D-psicose/D-tagatose/L-ribulose 3-epimerase